MDATRLLEQQHREVERLFERCLDEEGTQHDKDEIFGLLADAFATHCAIEERVFYPAVFVGDLKDELREAVEEHLGAKRVASDILQLELTEPMWKAKVQFMRELVVHHVAEEEDDLFPKVRQIFSTEELESIGEEMAELIDALRDFSPRSELPREAESAPDLDAESGHP